MSEDSFNLGGRRQRKSVPLMNDPHRKREKGALSSPRKEREKAPDLVRRFLCSKKEGERESSAGEGVQFSRIKRQKRGGGEIISSEDNGGGHVAPSPKGSIHQLFQRRGGSNSTTKMSYDLS